MALTKSQAAAIVKVVAGDGVSLLHIGVSPAGSMPAGWMPEALGASESRRGSRSASMFVCTGVADATSRALREALSRRPASLPGVMSAGVINRSPMIGTDQSSALVVMDDGAQYVFDWQATLNSRNPVISKKTDWLNSRGGVLFMQFPGFSG